MIPWLTLLGLVPIAGALLLFLPIGAFGRWLGMALSLVTLGIGVQVGVLFAAGTPLAETVSWIPAAGAWWALDLDGMGLVLVLLTVVLVPLVLAAEWRLIPAIGRWSPRVFAALVLLLEGLSLFVFLAGDVLLFYLFFEATLIPMYFLIGGFGGPKRAAAALKFLLFSLGGGLVMLCSIIGLHAVTAATGRPTYLLGDLMALTLDGATGRLLMVGFLVAFIVKAPMVPVHTWLPDAAEQSSPGTAVLLVGVLDKIGTFGMIKFCLGLFPEASVWAAPVMCVLALVSIIYGALAAIGSTNLMRLVAYTSVSHFGLMVLGIYAFTSTSLSGSIFYMVNHGFSTAALFLVVGFLVHRRGSAEVSAFGGAHKTAPVLAGLFLLAGLSSAALPGMSSFVSEFLVLAGTWSRYPGLAAVAALAMVLSAVYVLRAYRKTMTGPVTEQTATLVATDLSLLERFVSGALIAIVLLFGFWPQPVLQVIEPVSTHVLGHVGVTDPVLQVSKGGK